MNPPDDMLDAIYLGDDPDTAALVVADWYDEHDQPERARLIRLCVRLTQMAVDDPARYEVADERDRLLLLHLESIYGRIPLTDNPGRFGWFRYLLDDWGQPQSVHVEDTFASEVDLGGQINRWMDRTPVRRLFFGRHPESNRFREPFFQQSPETMVGATLAGYCRLRGLQSADHPIEITQRHCAG